MPYVSGKTGKLKIGDAYFPITDWTLSLKCELTKFATANSGGWKTAVPGTRDASGSATIRLDGAPPEVGVSAQFELEHGDFDGSGSRKYTFTGVIVDRTVAVNVDTGEAIQATIAFEAISSVTESNS